MHELMKEIWICENLWSELFTHKTTIHAWICNFLGNAMDRVRHTTQRWLNCTRHGRKLYLSFSNEWHQYWIVWGNSTATRLFMMCAFWFKVVSSMKVGKSELVPVGDDQQVGNLVSYVGL